jgi:hypothetical protein
VLGLVGFLTTGVAAAMDAPSAAIGESKAAAALLPINLKLPDVLRRLALSMWQRSLTFRRQCARLSEHPAVVVTIELVPHTWHGRGVMRIERHDSGMSAIVEIELRRPEMYSELISHELEHVLEDIDGVDVPRLARQGLDGVINADRTYETARALAVGRTVASEVLSHEPSLGRLFRFRSDSTHRNIHTGDACGW